MRQRLPIVIACLIFVGLNSLVLHRTWGTPIGLCSRIPLNQSRIPPEMDKPLLYPNAQLLSVDARSDYTWHHAIYRTPDVHSKVLEYYRTTLPKQGWLMLEGGPSPMFVWTDCEGPTPWNLDLNIAIEVFENGDTGLHILTFRWPDLHNIPVLQGVRQLEEHSVQETSGTRSSITTYLTSAKPGEVESYYKSILLQHGWGFNTDSGPITSAQGIIFGAGGESGSLSMALLITAKPLAMDLIKVEMRLEESTFCFEGC